MLLLHKKHNVCYNHVVQATRLTLRLLVHNITLKCE